MYPEEPTFRPPDPTFFGDSRQQEIAERLRRGRDSLGGRYYDAMYDAGVTGQLNTPAQQAEVAARLEGEAQAATQPPMTAPPSPVTRLPMAAQNTPPATGRASVKNVISARGCSGPAGHTARPEPSKNSGAPSVGQAISFLVGLTALILLFVYGSAPPNAAQPGPPWWVGFGWFVGSIAFMVGAFARWLGGEPDHNPERLP